MKTGELIAVTAIVAIILGVLMSIMGNHSTAINYLWSGNGQSLQPIAQAASGSSILGGPSLSAQRIDQILSNAGSPAAGTGQTFYNDSVKYGIDSAYALAFFHHESGYGTSGESVQSLSIGNLRCITGYACQDNFAWFPSWREGIDAWYRLISGPYYVGQGLITLPQIIAKYAPSGDGNDESAYVQAVQRDVQNWRQS